MRNMKILPFWKLAETFDKTVTIVLIQYRNPDKHKGALSVSLPHHKRPEFNLCRYRERECRHPKGARITDGTKRESYGNMNPSAFFPQFLQRKAAFVSSVLLH